MEHAISGIMMQRMSSKEIFSLLFGDKHLRRIFAYLLLEMVWDMLPIASGLEGFSDHIAKTDICCVQCTYY